MKILVAVLIAFSLKASADKLAGEKFLLKSITAERCVHYFGVGKSFWECRNAMSRFYKVVDMHFTKDAKKKPVAIAFRKKFFEILLEPAVHAYLFDLQERLNGTDPIYLWDHAVETFGGDRKKALEVIAVMLQDNGFGVNLDYLDAKYKKKTEGIVTLLRDIYAKTLSHSNFYPYPSGINLTQRDLYHFYNVAYITQVLDGKGKTKLATFSPFMFNTLYEFIVEFCVKAKGKWPECVNQKSMDASKNPITWGDLYLGYAGPIWSRNMDETFPDFNEFVINFAANPEDFIKEVFRNGH